MPVMCVDHPSLCVGRGALWIFTIEYTGRGWLWIVRVDTWDVASRDLFASNTRDVASRGLASCATKDVADSYAGHGLATQGVKCAYFTSSCPCGFPDILLAPRHQQNLGSSRAGIVDWEVHEIYTLPGYGQGTCGS